MADATSTYKFGTRRITYLNPGTVQILFQENKDIIGCHASSGKNIPLKKNGKKNENLFEL